MAMLSHFSQIIFVYKCIWIIYPPANIIYIIIIISIL